MKLACQIVQDLLPLYEEGVCSEQSNEAVKEHLCECEVCKTLLEKTRELSKAELVCVPSAEERVVKKSFKKIRRRWILSVIAMVMVVPVYFLGLLGYNEHHAEGVCFSNLNELWSCSRYLDALEEADMERAASYVDFSELYLEYREAIEMQPEDFMPDYQPIQIGEQRYMAYPSFAECYLSDPDDAQIWAYLIYNCVNEAPIPIDIWNEVIQGDEEGQPLQDQGYRMPNGICYFPYETQWGTFMLVDTVWEALQEEDEILFSDFFALMPEEMYLDLEPIIEEKAQQNYEAVQARMKDVIGLDAQGFEAYMRSYYAKKLAGIEVISVTDYDYQDAYYSLGKWNVTYEVKLSYEGAEYRVRFEFYAKEGSIVHLYAVASDEDCAILEDILDLLAPRM